MADTKLSALTEVTTLQDADEFYVNDAGVSKRITRANLKSSMAPDAATLTAQGIVELATGAETNTGTDATRAVTPDGLDDWTGSAQITTLGTLTTLTVDDITINGNTISSGGASTLAITPTAGQSITFDGAITVDAGVMAGATSITSTSFVGALTGNADTATALETARTIGGTSFDGTANIVPATITVADESADTTCNVLYVTAATGDLPPKTGTNLTFNSSTGALTATSFVGSLTGQADTVATISGLAPDTATTQATQAAITTCANLATVGTITTGVWNGTAIEGTAIASTGEVGGTKFLREDGDGTCSWQAVAGSGDVSKVGTPVDSQIGVWTGDGTIEGDVDFTFDTSTNTFALAGIAGTSILAAGAANILVDSPRGTMTLSNIDALDATTEATIEAAIDTLANLTSAASLATIGTITTGVWNGTAIEGTAIASTGEAAGTKYLREDGDGTCSWQAVAGGGDVSKVGTPVDSQIGVWTGDGTIEGDTALTFDTSTDTFSVGASGNINFGAVTVLADSAGTTTLQNIDALDATTEATIEAAIDTLANLTSAAALATVGTVTTGTWNAGAIDNGTSDITSGGTLALDVDGTAASAGSLTMGAGSDASVFFNGTHVEINITGGVAGTPVGYQITQNFTAGELLADGDLCYMKPADNKMWKANAATASAAEAKGLLAISMAATSADAAGKFLLKGIYVTTGLTAGLTYVGETDGTMTATAPSTSGDTVRIIGQAESTTHLHFDPDQTYIEI